MSLTNKIRLDKGLEPLLPGSDMAMVAAYVRSREIVTEFSHTRPDKRLCFSALDDAEVKYTWAGENIAAGHPSPEAVVDAWMNSDGHLENILSPHFTHLAIGYCYMPADEYRHYAVQLFYTPVG